MIIVFKVKSLLDQTVDLVPPSFIFSCRVDEQHNSTSETISGWIDRTFNLLSASIHLNKQQSAVMTALRCSEQSASIDQAIGEGLNVCLSLSLCEQKQRQHLM